MIFKYNCLYTGDKDKSLLINTINCSTSKSFDYLFLGLLCYRVFLLIRNIKYPLQIDITTWLLFSKVTANTVVNLLLNHINLFWIQKL